MKKRVVAGVVAGWLIVATVWASQNVLRGAMEGAPAAAGAEFQAALIQTLPWIPVTIAVIALATRFPVTAATWRRHLPIHVVGFVLLLWLENVLVVLGYWITAGSWGGLATLASQGVHWAILRAHVAALVYMAIAASTQMIAYYRETRSRELRVARLEGQLARARLDALNAQIRPHFLFNTLHTIGQLWRSGRADDADAMLDHLGTLFQRVRRSTQRQLVSLHDELDMVRAYLDIEKMRFRDRLDVIVDADDAALDCGVPPLLLQPLVENAVRHGIAATSSAGRVDVRARLRNGHLELTVEDDGPGPGNGANEGAGTGIRNTRERLEQVFGRTHSFRITMREPHGTRVYIELPASSVENGGESETADGMPARG